MNRLQLAEIEEIETIDEGFKIEDKQQATWALRKIKALKLQVEETTELADAEIERIKFWQENENKSALDSIEFFEHLLKEYMDSERAEDPKLKTVKLPHGTLRFRKQQPLFEREDAELINWAKNADKLNLVKVKESLDWSGLKKEIAVIAGNAVIKETGEVMDLIKVVEREDKFEVVIS